MITAPDIWQGNNLDFRMMKGQNRLLTLCINVDGTEGDALKLFHPAQILFKIRDYQVTRKW
jgi:hypothetical protein